MDRFTNLLLFFLIQALLFPACEKYNDDPVFPASDFICSGKYQGTYWPTDAWRECDPKEVGMDPKLLKDLNAEIRDILESGIEFQTLIIIKDGYIVAEQYYSDEYNEQSLHRIYSCTKSLVGASIGIAMNLGLIGDVNETMLSYFPDHDFQHMGEEKQNIRLHHLLTMSAGFEWYELEYLYSDDRNTFGQWSDDGYRVGFVLDRPMIAAPGEEYAYNSGISHVLSGILQAVSGMRTDSFVQENIFKALGIEEYYWPVNAEGVAYGGSGVQLRPRDMARFGYLYLMEGEWDGKQIIPESWVEVSRQKHMPRKYIPNGFYGYQFWVSDYGTYSAVGYDGQWITIIPDQKMVVVFNNNFDESISEQWGIPERY